MSNQEVVYTLSLRDLLTGKIKDADGAASKFEGTLGQVQSKLGDVGRAVGIAFGAAAVVGFGVSVFNVTRQLDSLKIGLNQISGGQGQETFEYLTDFSNRLGVNLQSAASGYMKIGAAARETALEGEQTRNIFEAVAEASAVFGLGAYETEGALLAISQMISKGTVSAEELRGQLGERLPGAFQVAARAMGVTTQKLGEMMQKGELVATDFLPRFANQLRQEISGGVPEAMQSLNAEFARTQNEILLLQEKIGNDLRPIFLGLLEAFSDGIDMLRSLWEWIGKNKTILLTMGTAVVAGATAWGVYTVAMKAATIWTALETSLLIGLGTAVEWVNAMFLASPIGWIVVGIAAIAAAVVYCYQKFAEFRGVLFGVWEFIKEWVRIVGDAFSGLGRTLKGVFSLNPQEIQAGMLQTVDVVRGAAKRLAEAAKRGYEEGLADFAKDEAAKTANAPKTGPAPKAPKAPAPVGLADQTKGAKGTKAITITVNIGSLIKDFKISTTNITDATGKVREAVTQALLAAVNDSQIIAE